MDNKVKGGNLLGKEIITDVLVIGGGAAGTRAALAAYQAGARVTLAVKGELGVMGVRGAGATGSGTPRYLHMFSSMAKRFNIADEVESYYKRAIRAGLGIADRQMVRALVDGAFEAKQNLDKWGLVLGSDNPENPGGIECNITPMPGLANMVRASRSINVIQHVMITDLLVEDNFCKGVLAVDEVNAETFVIKAGSVILATGGCAQLFSFSFHPSCITGDGYAMGYEAGALLMNMEFEQMFIATVYPTVTMAPYPVWGLYPRVLNNNKQEFLQDYLPQGVSLKECMDKKMQHGPFSARDAAKYLDIAMVNEAKAGRANEHNAFYLEVPSKVRENPGLLFPEFGDWYAYRGINWDEDYVEINVAHHCSNGGFKIDENGQTTLSGLYAVGETATGAYGADRLGGAMMTSCQVFGARAGKNAADTARSKGVPDINKQLVDSKMENIARVVAAKGKQKPAEARKALQKKLWQELLVVRSKKSLEMVLQEILAAREGLLRLNVENPRDLVSMLELRNMLVSAEIIASAGLKRDESRGSHYREDFPDRDDSKWQKAITIKKVNGEMQLNTLMVDENWKRDEADLGWWG
jgi:fumarate reductase (CoM/CoB) subunit A